VHYQLNLNKKIMRKYLLLFLVLGILNASFSQAPLKKGQKQLNMGLGASGYGLPGYIGMDFSIHPDITLGGELAFNLNGFNYVIPKFNANYHFNTLIGIPPEFDFYAGANVGFLIWFGDDDYVSGLDLGLQVGGRWYWNNKWGLNLEFGGGTGWGTKFGVSMKI
jgi:hypothetical protein